ncbi:MAG: SDR family oxidoreductase [Chloroflexota bacterium]
MSEELRFDGRVVIVTGAGGGLGREYAKLLAARGASVVVNDLGGTVNGQGGDNSAADKVVAEIKAAGGEAVANYESVEDGERIVEQAMDTYGKIDILINNAGILRDKSFAKMTEEEWSSVYRVHLYGSFKTTHAAWPHLRANGYGRMVMAASSSGAYGNFGQANYGAMKMGLIGLIRTLSLEGMKYDIKSNAILPYGGTRMTEGIVPEQVYKVTAPENASPMVAYLCHESFNETGQVYEVGGGFMSKIRWQRSKGHLFPVSDGLTIEDVAANWDSVTDFDSPAYPTSAADAYQEILKNVG